MTQIPEPIAVTRQQAAQMLGISMTEVDDERRAGRLVARKHGRKVLIPVAELRRWVDALPSDEMRFAPSPDVKLLSADAGWRGVLPVCRREQERLHPKSPEHGLALSINHRRAGAGIGAT